ncbi:hypothetical protein GCM10009780_67760 [Actinomadura alba]
MAIRPATGSSAVAQPASTISCSERPAMGIQFSDKTDVPGALAHVNVPLSAGYFLTISIDLLLGTT